GYALSWLMLVLETRRVVGPGTFTRLSSSGLGAARALGRGLGSPVLGGLLGGQVFVLLERLLASTLGVGAVSTLSYARGVVFTPTIVSQSIALGLYPGMVRAYEAEDIAHVRGSVLRGLRATLFLAVVFAAFLALFAHSTTDLLLRRGAFDPRAARQVAAALAVFTLALVGSMLMVFVARIFYAVAYFRGVVWTQVVALAVYAVVAFPLRSQWGTSGLALAFGVAEVAGGVFGLAIAGRKVGLAARAALLHAWVPAFGRAAIVAAALAAVRLAAGDDFVSLAVAAFVAGLVGAAVLWQATWPELDGVKRAARRLLPA
ncbi:MAG: putative peptidoglycan lipid flippase, partial [Gaiellaceae bacterium]|nr:putative peptidoglycan lipid flippase [Gaiellaceae bacterium]